MTHSKTPRASRKPRPDFPLFPHATGRWAKKVRGKFQYFGKVADDPKGEKALLLWLEQRDELLAGRKPRPRGDFLTVKDVVNRFLNDKLQLLDSGEIGQRTFDDYKATGEFVAEQLGRTRPVDDLAADDFQALRATMAKRWGPVRLGNEIQRVRSIFRHADDLLEKPVQFGKAFKKPSAKVIRLARAEKGPRDFSAKQIRDLLSTASTNLRAMILLGINGGMGNTDVGSLHFRAIDLDAGWLDFPRPKTGIPRRVPLWPETVEAIRQALKQRREPLDSAHADLLFITRQGHGYIADDYTHGLSDGFKWARELAGIEGRTFYDLRRTFQTVAEGAHDLAAVQAIMGHAPKSSDMSAVYRQRVDDARLLAVTNHVRAWLFGDQTNSIQSAG